MGTNRLGDGVLRARGEDSAQRGWIGGGCCDDVIHGGLRTGGHFGYDGAIFLFEIKNHLMDLASPPPRRTVYMDGVFDLFHVGHSAAIAQCTSRWGIVLTRVYCESNILQNA